MKRGTPVPKSTGTPVLTRTAVPSMQPEIARPCGWSKENAKTEALGTPVPRRLARPCKVHGREIASCTPVHIKSTAVSIADCRISRARRSHFPHKNTKFQKLKSPPLFTAVPTRPRRPRIPSKKHSKITPSPHPNPLQRKNPFFHDPNQNAEDQEHS